MSLIGRLTVVVTASVLALGVAVAMAETPIPASGEAPLEAVEGPSRKEYVAELEKTCKPGAEATQRAMKGVRDDVKANRISVATAKFEKATRIFGHTTSVISRDPRPVADSARLKQWFVYLFRQEQYLKEISTRLRAGQKIKAQRLIARFIHNGNLANNETLAFGFNYCSFKFTRYGF